MINRLPDVEAVFQFCNKRSTPFLDGYRPGHRVMENYEVLLWQ